MWIVGRLTEPLRNRAYLRFATGTYLPFAAGGIPLSTNTKGPALVAQGLRCSGRQN